MFSGLRESVAETGARIKDEFERRRSVAGEFVGKLLGDVTYRKFDQDHRQVVDQGRLLCTNGEPAFKNAEEVAQAFSLIDLSIMNGAEFVTREQYLTLLRKLNNSKEIIDSEITAGNSNIVVQITNLGFNYSDEEWDKRTSNQEQELVKEIKVSHVGTALAQLKYYLQHQEIAKITDNSESTYLAEHSSDCVYLLELVLRKYPSLPVSVTKEIIDTNQQFIETVLTNDKYYHGDYAISECLDMVGKHGSEEAKLKINGILRQILTEGYKSSRKNRLRCESIQKWLLDNPYTKNSKVLEVKKRFMQDTLALYGIDGKKLINYWSRDYEISRNQLEDYPDSKIAREDVEKNQDIIGAKHFVRILELESDYKGATNYLNSEYGIVFFGRYSEQSLKRQYVEKDVIGNDHGLFVVAYADHNGAFNHYTNDVNSMQEQLGEVKLRICEVEDKKQLLHLTNKMRHKYGPLSFLIINGHGNRDSIMLGYLNEEEITKQDLLRKGMEAVSLALKKDAILILNSCGTGVWNGIARKAANRLGLLTYAPRKSTAIKEFKVNENRKRPIEMVRPLYYGRMVEMRYVGKR